MIPESSEEIVRERHPNAEIRRRPATYQMGQKAPTQPESWEVFPSGGMGYQPLGTGPTSAAAWNAAAEAVLAAKPKPTAVRIKREMLEDAAKLGVAVVPVDRIEDALDKGIPVIIEEDDGSESLLQRGDSGKYKTTPIAKK